MRATQIVHWPGKDTPACDKHFQQLTALASTLGFVLSSTPCEETACANCENEERKARTA